MFALVISAFPSQQVCNCLSYGREFFVMIQAFKRDTVACVIHTFNFRNISIVFSICFRFLYKVFESRIFLVAHLCYLFTTEKREQHTL
jgi:hypothetical protein